MNKKLTLAWTFDAPMNTMYAGQGDHGLSVNDVDNDGYDEIIYGSLVINNDGTVLNCTGLGHGDAMHVSDFNNDGRIEVFQVHENAGVEYQIELHDAETGEVIWGVPTGKDTGRGMAADIDPRYPGAEMWGAVNGDTFDCNGNVIYKGKKPSVNFSIFWDGDLLTELFDYDKSYTRSSEMGLRKGKDQRSALRKGHDRKQRHKGKSLPHCRYLRRLARGSHIEMHRRSFKDQDLLHSLPDRIFRTLPAFEPRIPRRHSMAEHGI